MANKTFLFMTAALEGSGALPSRSAAYRYVPASCTQDELPQAVKQIEAAHGGKVIGFVDREMVNEMNRIMDDFERGLT